MKKLGKGNLKKIFDFGAWLAEKTGNIQDRDRSLLSRKKGDHIQLDLLGVSFRINAEKYEVFSMEKPFRWTNLAIRFYPEGGKEKWIWTVKSKRGYEFHGTVSEGRMILAIMEAMDIR